MNKKPNILLLFSDQHQAACLGAENHSDVMTPNLDMLARGGVRFSRGYCQNAICMPSRVSMMTGHHPRQLGLYDNGDKPDTLDRVTPLSTYFSSQGYTTAAFGKRHLRKGKVDQGWDYHKSHLAIDGDKDNYIKWIDRAGYTDEFARDWAAENGSGPKGSSWEGKEIPYTPFSFRISELPEDKTMEAYTASETIRFIQNQAKNGEPFFCWSSFYRPHQPYTPLKKYFDNYASSEWGRGRRFALENKTGFDGIKKPSSFPHDFDKIEKTLPPMFQGQYNGENRVWCINKARKDEQIFRDYLAAYYALVEEIDSCVGQIIETLKAEGIYDNTIIIYTADHGDFVGSHGMVEKCAPGHNVYEETLRVPFIIHYPKELAAGEVNQALVELTDLYPTLAELTGNEIPLYDLPLTGKSLLPLLAKEKSPVQEEFREFTVSLNRSQATVITRDYKLGIWLEPDNGDGSIDFRDFGNMLFDLKKDPEELINRYEDDDYRDIREKLKACYDNWAEMI